MTRYRNSKQKPITDSYQSALESRVETPDSISQQAVTRNCLCEQPCPDKYLPESKYSEK